MSNIPEILQALYLKNLSFFKKQNPRIYEVLSNTKPDHTEIVISDDGKIDLIYRNKSIYGGDGIKYAEDEVKEFQNIYKKGIRTSSLTTITPGLYTSPRFFHSHLDHTIRKLYEVAEELDLNTIHNNERHDFLIVTGIGLGLHITEILEHINIQNLLILESDFELLALSCFFTDWEDIYTKQSSKNKKSITLVLLNNQEESTEQGSLWNELIKRAPHFPFNSVTYNHGKHDRYGEILKKINSDVTMFISLWGFYDDEANQLNHILHNLKNEIKLVPEKSNFEWTKPVIVCGSGPSLDAKIEQLKSIREKCVLISAGSSLHALISYDLCPDYHVELESDYGVYELLSTLDGEVLKNITLICALQCSPHITNLFKDCLAYVKDSMAIGDIIEDKDNKLYEATPTCVNAALSIAFLYMAKDIFLFGTDFGFYKIDNHHSKNSFYRKKEFDSKKVRELKDISEKSIQTSFKKEGYMGDCLTTSTYYTTKRRIEMSIYLQTMKYRFNVFNLGDGLIIDKTTHINKSEIVNIETTSDIQMEMSEKARLSGLSLSHKIEKHLLPAVSELCAILVRNLNEMENNIESLSSTCWSFSHYISVTFKKKYGSLEFFLRGTVWHYMLAGYSIAYACEHRRQEKVINEWRLRFIDFLQKLPEDLSSVIYKNRDSIYSDPLLRKTIREK